MTEYLIINKRINGNTANFFVASKNKSREHKGFLSEEQIKADPNLNVQMINEYNKEMTKKQELEDLRITTDDFLSDKSIPQEVRDKIENFFTQYAVFVSSYDENSFIMCKINSQDQMETAEVELNDSEPNLKQVFIMSDYYDPDDGTRRIYEVLDTKLNKVTLTPSEQGKATVLNEDGGVFEFNPETDILVPVLVYKSVVSHTGGSKKKSKQIRKHQS